MINEKKKAMDIEELNKLLSYYVDVIDEEYIQIDVMFVKKLVMQRNFIRHGC